ncbi:MAG: sulfatase [Myxococcota bacterium]
MTRGLFAALLSTAILAVAVAWWGGGRGGAGTPSRPHIVLVILDTLRADRLGCYGHPAGASPELDALAKNGVRFDHVVAQSPWTRPSIGSFLTSRYPRELGLYDEQGDALRDGATTLPEVLGAHGYRTLGATANPNINSTYNFHQGFDVYLDSNVVFRWMAPVDDQVHPDERPLYRANELFREVFRHLEDETPDERRRPHYVQLDLMEMHEWGQHRRLLRSEYRPLYPHLPPIERHYMRMLRQVSADVGRFVEELEARPGWENTLFVVVSDHGEGLTSHPHVPHSRTHGRLLYDSQLRVPWILYATASGWLPRGRVVRQRARLLDLMPTLLDLVGLRGSQRMRGHSLLPAIRAGERVGLPPRFFAETQFQGHHKVAVASEERIYIENRDGHPRLPPRELQPTSAPQDGRRTDRLEAHRAPAQRLERSLRRWEERTPRKRPAAAGQDLSAVEAEQLRALGYVP